ncbi:hypothetical protein [Rickettsia helvetica]|uniref:ETS domain-containing protein n=1 Tax=Rickettsia helvetica TaxID=35789 RepID=A0ABM9NCM0_RICHE|nr:hypothetical protein [Rickettsia helvetica]
MIISFLLSILKYINLNFINKVSYENFYYIIYYYSLYNINANNLNSHIAYCDNIQVEQQEDLVIQKLVKLFAAETNCIISGCLQQWDVQDNRVKYSIAWQEQCGPVIYGQVSTRRQW